MIPAAILSNSLLPVLVRVNPWFVSSSPPKFSKYLAPFNWITKSLIIFPPALKVFDGCDPLLCFFTEHWSKQADS